MTVIAASGACVYVEAGTPTTLSLSLSLSLHACRAEEAEANLSKVLDDQRALLRRERRREREAQVSE